MRVFRVVAAVTLLAGPAYAQAPIQKYGDPDKPKTPQQIEGERSAERAYKNSLGNIPNQGPTDPWGNVRSEKAPKAADKAATKAAPAKPRTRTGGTVN